MRRSLDAYLGNFGETLIADPNVMSHEIEREIPLSPVAPLQAKKQKIENFQENWFLYSSLFIGLFKISKFIVGKLPPRSILGSFHRGIEPIVDGASSLVPAYLAYQILKIKKAEKETAKGA